MKSVIVNLRNALRARRGERPAGHPWLASYPSGVDWAADVPVGPVHGFIDDAAARFGNRPCVDFLGRRYTYAEIHDLVNRAAKGFRQLGVRKSVRVGLCLPNTPYYVVCYYAILKAGGTVVNLNPLYVERELAHLVEDAGIDIMVTLDLRQLYPKVAALLGATRLRTLVVCPMSDILPAVKGLMYLVFKRSEIVDIPDDLQHVSYGRLIDNDGAGDPPPLDVWRDVAVLQYTGGTTGTPKGAMLTHANLAANVHQVRAWAPGIDEGAERILGILPLFHVFAMTLVMNLGVAVGAELVLVPRFEPESALDIIDDRDITILMGVPTIFTAINARDDVGKRDLSSLKFAVSGGAALAPAVRERFESLTGCALVEGYGLSECAPVVTCNPLGGGGKDGSIGLPVPGTVVEIRATDGGRKALPVGEKGEICVIGPQVMAGYWNRDDETDEALAGGRLHTGDVGYIDEDGYVFLVDRIKELIICSGYNVYPRVIEDAILEHDAVVEAAVIGIPDDYRGEAPKAFVRRKGEARLDADELKAFLKERLSPIELPAAIEFRDELPRTPVGKVSRKDLAAEEAARREGGDEPGRKEA